MLDWRRHGPKISTPPCGCVYRIDIVRRMRRSGRKVLNIMLNKENDFEEKKEVGETKRKREKIPTDKERMKGERGRPWIAPMEIAQKRRKRRRFGKGKGSKESVITHLFGGSKSRQDALINQILLHPTNNKKLPRGRYENRSLTLLRKKWLALSGKLVSG